MILPLLFTLTYCRDTCLPGSSMCVDNMLKVCDINGYWITTDCSKDTECKLKENIMTCVKHENDDRKDSELIKKLLKLTKDKEFVRKLRSELESDSDQSTENDTTETTNKKRIKSEDENISSNKDKTSHKNEDERKDNISKAVNEDNVNEDNTNEENTSQKKRKTRKNNSTKIMRKKSMDTSNEHKGNNTQYKTQAKNKEENQSVKTITYYADVIKKKAPDVVTITTTVIQHDSNVGIDIEFLDKKDKQMNSSVSETALQQHSNASNNKKQMESRGGNGSTAKSPASHNNTATNMQKAGMPDTKLNGQLGDNRSSNNASSKQSNGKASRSANPSSAGGNNNKTNGKTNSNLSGTNSNNTNNSSGGNNKTNDSGSGNSSGSNNNSSSGGENNKSNSGSGNSSGSNNNSSSSGGNNKSNSGSTGNNSTNNKANNSNSNSSNNNKDNSNNNNKDNNNNNKDNNNNNIDNNKKESSSGGKVDISSEQIMNAMSKSGYQPNSEYVDAIAKAVKESFDDMNMAAMFIAQTAHEAGGFKYIEEIDCAGSTKCADQYGASEGAPGKSYHGRGFIQLSWPANYKEAGEYLKKDLFNNPEMVAEDSLLGAQVSIWYWKNRVETAPGVKENHFGATTKAINGALECTGQNVEKSQNRYKIYKDLVEILNISNPADESGCY